MIEISCSEAEYLRERLGDNFTCAVTNRGKGAKHKHRYITEDINILRLLPENAEASAIVAAYDARRGWRRG